VWVTGGSLIKGRVDERAQHRYLRRRSIGSAAPAPACSARRAALSG